MDEPYAAQFARIAMDLHTRAGLDETVEQVAHFAHSAVGCDCSDVILVQRRKRIEVLAATDPLAEKAEQVQLEQDEGPWLSMLGDDRTYALVHDTAHDQRWPQWSRRLHQLGLASALSVRLATTQSTIGALNLYCHSANRFDDDDVAVAHILARHASVALASARQESTLWQAIDARKVIGQAQGILMERFSLDAEQAFAVLRRYSQEHNLKLHEVARRLIETRRLPDRSD